MINRADNTRRRHARERLFIRLSFGCVCAALLFLVALLGDVAWQGWRSLISVSVRMEVFFDPQKVGADGQASALKYQSLYVAALDAHFDEYLSRREKKELKRLASYGGGVQLRDLVRAEPSLVGQRTKIWLPLSAHAESYIKNPELAKLPAEQRVVSDRQIAWLDSLSRSGDIRRSFNTRFFTAADSRDAELAGIGSALRGSFLTLLLTFLLSFPTAVLAALYLEMFAPRNRWFDFIEININNLAAVPSVIFGLLGLTVFIGFFGMPRSSSLVGGMTLSLMTLPTVIIAARAAIRAVPPSLLAGAMSLGATRMQGVFHHVVPAAMPGILTGTIIGMAQALGETAPLLMIGMLAFITEAPTGFTDAATALPTQIFLWANNPERAFAEHAAAAIVCLLLFLILMNATATVIRRRMEIKW